ncbi:hypothetical protein KKC91_06025 [bacterium]|nr:hypothetical protein [bacterium]
MLGFKIKKIITSRTFAIVMLILSTFWDAGGTCLTLGHNLSRDGNPLVRGMNWNQVLMFMVISHTIFIISFIFAWRKQKAIWPEQNRTFFPFVADRLKEGFAFNFSRDHMKNELVWAGMLALWLPTAAHCLAGIIITSALVGGPSFLDVLGLVGIHNVRMAQRITTLLIIVIAVPLAHYPMYLKYSLDRDKRKETRT